MPSLTIRHLTTYRYRRPVAFGEHRMMLHPRDSHDQRVVQADLKISPKPSSLRFVQDAFGNHVGIALFWRRSTELSFESIVHLENSPREIALDLEDAGQAFPVGYRVSELRDLAPYVERQPHDPTTRLRDGLGEFLLPSGSIGAFELLTLRWLPRHLDIDRTSDQDIQEIVVTTNLTPRKCLAFKTPFQPCLPSLERMCKSASLNLVALRSGIQEVRFSTKQTAIHVSLI